MALHPTAALHGMTSVDLEPYLFSILPLVVLAQFVQMYGTWIREYFCPK